MFGALLLLLLRPGGALLLLLRIDWILLLLRLFGALLLLFLRPGGALLLLPSASGWLAGPFFSFVSSCVLRFRLAATEIPGAVSGGGGGLDGDTSWGAGYGGDVGRVDRR
jgi:hypothetical protein